MDELINFLQDDQQRINTAAYELNLTMIYIQKVEGENDFSLTMDELRKVYDKLCSAEDLIADTIYNFQEKMKQNG